MIYVMTIILIPPMKNLEGFSSVAERIEICIQLKLNSLQYYDICLFNFLWARSENKMAQKPQWKLQNPKLLERGRVFSLQRV